MKIIITGGGTGGHFYPLLSVCEAIQKIAEEEKIASLKIVYMADDPYDRNALLRYRLEYKKIYAGKIRNYFSLRNFTDVIKTISGIFKALWAIYLDYPDVIYSKGGYSSFPVVFAAKVLNIPLVIHESDSVPGKVNLWSSKFAKRIAISFKESAVYFSGKPIALTGNPVRKEFFILASERGKQFFGLEEGVPVVLVIGGSQGAQVINQTIIQGLTELVKDYQIIHQTGKANFEEIFSISKITLEKSPFANRYRPFAFFYELQKRMCYGAADIAVSRAGSGSIFELAASGLPSILIPLKNSAQDHQKENAYGYALSGASDVIEEGNLSPHVLKSEIDLLAKNQPRRESMKIAAKAFARPDAAEKIAREIIAVALEHA